jgi:hypothetical protein
MLFVRGLASQKHHQTWEVYPETMASLHVFASLAILPTALEILVENCDWPTDPSKVADIT